MVQVVETGLGTHWRVARLHMNACVVRPPGNMPLEQVRVCEAFDVVAVSAEEAPGTDV